MELSFEIQHLQDFLELLGSVWNLKNLVERKKFKNITFFLVFGLEKITKKKKYGGKFGGKIVRNK